MSRSYRDLLLALKSLQPRDERTRAAIAQLLGIAWGEEGGTLAAPEPSAEADKAPERFPNNQIRDEPSLVVPKADAEQPDAAAVPLPIGVQSLSSPALQPDWLEQVTPLAKPANGPGIRVLEPEALFRPQKAQSILAIALATQEPFGALDIEEIVTAVGRGAALSSVPRQSVLTLARGVQLLVDRGDGLLPFRADVKRVERKISRLVGPDSLEVLNFACCPSRGVGRGPRRNWADYFAHHHAPIGSRVICVTDLGIGHPAGTEIPAGPEEWLEFDARLRAADCRLLVLVPYHRDRWPPELTRRMSLLHWDRNTNASHAAAVVRRHV